VQNVYDGSVGCVYSKCISRNKLDMKNEKCEPSYSANPRLSNCWVQNVYDGSVGCKMYITEQVGHEK
jgi:hypothetical protein